MGLRAPGLMAHETQIPGTLGLGLEPQEFRLSRSRPMGHKSLGLGQKSLGQSRDFEL